MDIISPDDDYDFEGDLNNQKTYELIISEVESLEWFHRTLFKYVLLDGISMREMERQTGISYNVIHKSITATKLHIKNKIRYDN